MAGSSVGRFFDLDWLRRIEEARNIPIIFITSGDASKFRGAGDVGGRGGIFSEAD